MVLELNKHDAPTWLEGILSETPEGGTPTMALLKGVKDKALGAKIADVENYNTSVNARLRRRVPERLEAIDAAAIMMHLFTFKRIVMSQDENADDSGILSVYVPGTSDIWSQFSKGTRSSKGIYVTNTLFMEAQVERLGINKTLEIGEVLKSIGRFAPIVSVTKDPNLVVVNNGVFNREIGDIEPFSPDYIFTKKVGVNFNPTGVNPIITMPDGNTWDVESWLSDLSVSKDVNTLFWQVVSAAVQVNRGWNKSIWFYAESGNNGKGTVGQLIKNLLGKGNYSSLSVDDFNHEFLKADLLTAVANIADENNVGTYIDTVKDYKASVTGDDILVNRKHKDPVRLQFLGLNIQMMNGLPRTKDSSESLYRRLLIVPFTKSFTNNGERSYIKTDYINRQDVLEYVLAKVLLMDFNEFIVPAESVAVLEQYKEKNNPVLDFWNEHKDEFKWDLLPKRFLFDLYKKWYEGTNPNAKGSMSSRSFVDNLAQIIEGSDVWENRLTAASNPGYSHLKMDEDEPLITQYGLDRPLKNGQPTEWMDAHGSSINPVKRREFIRKPKYYGLLKK